MTPSTAASTISKGGRVATGKVIQIIGPVVDIEFPPEQLPDIYNAVEIPEPVVSTARAPLVTARP